MGVSGRTAGWLAAASLALVLAGIAGCGSSDAPAATASSPVLPAAKPTARPVIAAVGDIACESALPATANSCQHQAVGDAITKLRPDQVWLLGDLQYLKGDLNEFQNSFGKAFGPLRNRWRPVPGNHEYATPGAAGYYDFFGKTAGPARRGYYSFNIAGWHVVALNSNCTIVDCSAGSAQANWLREDLRRNKRLCTAALWHHPRFSSSAGHGNNLLVSPLWSILQNRHADLVLSGHDHDFEVFSRQDVNGRRDRKGMIQIVSGAGGKSWYRFGQIKPNSLVRIANSFGFAKLRLNKNSFDWSYVNTGGVVEAKGSARCI